MLKKFTLGLALCLSASSLVSAAAAAAAARPAKQFYVGTLKRLPGGKMVLETPTNTFELEFASRSASREAQALLGAQVTVTAEKTKDGLKVHSSSTGPVSCLPPNAK